MQESQSDTRISMKSVRSVVDGFLNEAEQFDDLTMLCLEYKGAV